jgi:hypothetical protein
MADFKSGHLTKFEKQYVVDSYSSNLGYLVAKDASTTIDLIGKLQSQNTLLSERISVESDFYMLIAETDFLKKADIAQQSINGLDYFFLLEARSIFNEINGLQTKISGSDIKDCSMPEIPSYICANSGVSGECWQN